MAFINVSKALLRRIKISNKLLSASFSDYRNSEISIPDVNKPQNNALLHNLRSSSSAAELFSIISNNSKSFDDQHALQALKMIAEFHKTEKLSLTSDPTFEKLCLKLRQHSRNMEINEIVDTIKYLNIIGVSVNSTIFQILLQTIRQRINELNMKQIIFLDYLLHRIVNNNLTSALQLATPLLFQIQLPRFLDEVANSKQLVDCLEFACAHNIPINNTTAIATHLLMTDSIDLLDAKDIIMCLGKSDINFNAPASVFYKLFMSCLNILSNNINNLLEKEVYVLLDRMKIKIIDEKQGNLYHSTFFDACAQYAIDKNVSFYNCMYVSRYLSRMAHTHLPLLDYMSELIMIEPEVLEKAKYSTVIRYVNALSNANYKPTDWDQIKVYLFEHSIFDETKINLPWTKFASELASLDCYNDKLLDKIFNDKFLEEYLSRDYSFLDYLQLLLLDRATSSFYTNYDGGLPEHYKKEAMKSILPKETDPFLLPAIEVALNGKEYFVPSVVLPNGLYVDFIVALDENNEPEPISKYCDVSSKSQLNEFIKNNKSKVLCILNFHRGCYSLNMDRLRGIFDLICRIMENDGYHTLVISSKEWLALQPSERILFLQREITMKSKENSEISQQGADSFS